MAKTKPGKKDLDSYTIKGTHKVVRPGDCVLMRPSDSDKPPYVARVEKIEADHRNNVKVRVRWYYRPEESLGGRRQFHGAKELFLSDHYDMQSAHTIEGKCIVHSFKNYTKLENVGTEDYFCRFEYKAATGGFTPDRVAVYYKFEMPYNPDDLMVQCEGCKDGFHPSCMGMSIEEAKKLENFLCSDCSSDEDAKRTVNSFSVSPSLETKEEVRSHVLELESNLVSENEKFASIIGRVDKYRETKREMDRRFDMQYQRSIAEALDNHLTAVQRDHEHKSQIEERRIRDDAVREEAQRREKAVQEEKVRQQKLRAEAEIQARLEAERAAKAEAEKAVALEAERKAAEEAAKKKTSSAPPQGSASQVTESKQSAGNMTRGAENALKLEVERLRAYTELAAQNNAMRLRSNMKIARNIRQITGTKEIVRAKANELIKLISDPSCPDSISIASFADKFVSLCENSTGSFNRFVYSYGHVIVLVTSKVPIAMDILIAQLNRVCIYTVPKHIIYSRAAYESTEAYYKAIGYREEDGKIESTDSFLERLGSYMKLYGALVQTEVEQTQNLHGIAQGWAWLARFLNTLPANIYTVVALQSFLEMAGFTLCRRYGTQFKKLLRIIDRNFLTALKAQDDPKLNKAIVNIRNYLDSNQFLKEPEGWKLETNIESHSTNLW